MQASTLIARALRLINVPGRGATLGSTDLQAGFETLQELLDSESVSRIFNPGIRRHFFPTISAQHIYSYGPGIGNDFDTRDFDDPVPSAIEDAYVRTGSQLRTNELVASDRFDSDNGDWTFTDPPWQIFNGAANASSATAVDTLASTVPITTEIGPVYRIRLDAEVLAGDFTLSIDGFAIVVNATGEYEFTYTSTLTAPTPLVTPGAGGFSGSIFDLSIRRADRPDRTELVGNGSDYDIRVIDQKTYNRRFSKGTGGRPYQILWSRNHPSAEIRFDNSPSGPSDILVMDVTVNRVGVSDVDDEIRMHADARKWLRYQLASEMAPEYGKVLTPAVMQTLLDANNRLFSGNFRRNTLRVDNALLNKRSFDINRGDP